MTPPRNTSRETTGAGSWLGTLGGGVDSGAEDIFFYAENERRASCVALNLPRRAQLFQILTKAVQAEVENRVGLGPDDQIRHAHPVVGDVENSDLASRDISSE